MRTRSTVYFAPDEPPASGGGGGNNPPDQNLVAEAQRKQAAAEERAKAAERHATQIRQRLEALEGQGQSELEKANAKAARIEAEKQALQQEVAKRDARDAVRNALSRPGADGKPGTPPHDFEAMMRFVDIEKVKGDDSAATLVGELRTQHPFLFQSDAPANDPPAPPPHGAPIGGVPAPVGAYPGAPAPEMNGNEPDPKVQLGAGLASAIESFRARRGTEPPQ